jgi:hypothetical protein
MFSDIIARFPTAEAFIAWLKTDEGGRLVIRDEFATPDSPLVIIHYDKKKSDMEVAHAGLFRSVVWNMNTNRPVFVAPRRAATVEPAGLQDIQRVEDFIDGVMINMFHDGRGWRLATRTQLDAPGHFYGTRSFADLFWETFRGKGLTVDSLCPSETYSWVLQHPDERVVCPIPYGIPNLYLVEVGTITQNGTFTRVDVSSGKFHAMLPTKHDISTAQEIHDRVAAWGKRFGSAWKGLVVYTADGHRYKIRSAEYDAVAALRGNQAKRPFLWLERWSERKLTAYLRAFPEETHAAEAIVQRYKDLTQEFFDLYQQVYVSHGLPLGSAPHKFRKLLWEGRQGGKLHRYFGDFRTFMNEQDTARKLWLINYEERYVAAAGPMFNSAA